MAEVARAPFVGRERELAAVDRGLARARAGISALVTIVGDGGMGKTRLAEEAVDRAEGFAVAWGSGWPGAGAPPLWPWQAVFEQLGATSEAELLDHDAPTETERFARFRALSQTIAGVTADHPVLIVIDDAHEIDAGALLLARFVVRTLRTAPLAVIVAARPTPGDTQAAMAEVARESIVIDLAGLGVDDIDALVAAAGAGGLENLGAALHALTAGNPFLLHEALAGSGNELAILERAGRRLEERLTGFGDDDLVVFGAGAVLAPAPDLRMVAEVAAAAPATVHHAYREGVRRGVLNPAPAAPFTFVHDLLREAVVARLRPTDLARLHRRAAETIASEAGPSPERAARVAHHRLAAADAEDQRAVDAAVTACRVAARAYREGFAYEAAADLLQEGCRLLERAGRRPPADLLVEHARAELASGHLGVARTSFLAAVTHAEPVDPVVLADAAVGLGGIWVSEHRTVEMRERYDGVLRRARQGLGDLDAGLLVRLDARIAAENLYLRNGSLDAMLAAVEAARRLDDPLPLAESLSLLHHVLLGPASSAQRLAVAAELIEVASTAGDAVLALMGVMWRTVDLLLVADAEADRSLLELRQRADALRVESLLFVVEVIDVMRSLRAGRMADAEEEATRALERGLSVGDADAVNYYATHLLAMRWLQDRSNEVLPLARDAVDASTVVAGDATFVAALAAIAADAGGPSLEEAQRELDRLVENGLENLPPSSNLLVTLFCVVEAAWVLRDRRAAEAAYELLLPYADRPVMASIAVTCFGPVARVLGKAARTLGRVDDAIAHLEHAEVVARRIGNRPYLAVTRLELGAALLERGRSGDTARAEDLVADGAEALQRLGLDGRAKRLAEEAAAAATTTPPPPPASCRFVEQAWVVEAADARARVGDGVGMRYLARLLAAPGVSLGADELAGTDLGSARQEVVDETALQTYRRQVAVLQDRVEAANRRGDADRSDAAQRELDELLAHIAGATGLGGRPRAFADARERARTSVQKAIRRSLAAIGAQAPDLGELLARSIHTGLVCRFDPVEGLPQQWQVSGPPT